jgi:hypothetical protein
MDHVGVVVDNLEAAIPFFVELGMELEGEGTFEGEWMDRVAGLDDVRADVAMMRAHGGELVREVAQYEDSYRLCYVAAPRCILLALAEQLT